MTDSHDWVALVTFESVALLVSRLSNQVSRHARESEIHRSHLQKLYELSQNVLLLDRKKPVDQQLASLIQTTLQVKGVALWNAYDLHLCTSGTSEITDDEVRSTYFTERNEDDSVTATSRRVLRSGTRPIGSLVVCGHSLDDASGLQNVGNFSTASLIFNPLNPELNGLHWGWCGKSPLSMTAESFSSAKAISGSTRERGSVAPRRTDHSIQRSVGVGW